MPAQLHSPLGMGKAIRKTDPHNCRSHSQKYSRMLFSPAVIGFPYFNPSTA